MYTYFSKAQAFLETFSGSGFKFRKSLKLLIFISLLGKNILSEENGVGVWFCYYKDNIT